MSNPHTVFGTPAAWESAKPWCADRDDGLSAASTFGTVLDLLEDRLRGWLRQRRMKKDACYLRGDLLIDKTQYLEVNDWSCFTLEFLEACKTWLNEEGLDSYRIAIPTSPTAGQAVLIYPTTIRIWQEYEVPLATAVSEVCKSARAYRAE